MLTNTTRLLTPTRSLSLARFGRLLPRGCFRTSLCLRFTLDRGAGLCHEIRIKTYSHGAMGRGNGP
jgi:hypothetical protein